MKVNKQGIYILAQDTIEKIKSLVKPQKHQFQSDLFYEGQTPIVAYLLIEGQINLLKGKKLRANLEPGALIGLRELMQHTPMKLRAQICPNTSVCYLDRSTILDILENNYDQELNQLFAEITEHQAS